MAGFILSSAKVSVPTNDAERARIFLIDHQPYTRWSSTFFSSLARVWSCPLRSIPRRILCTEYCGLFGYQSVPSVLPLTQQPYVRPPGDAPVVTKLAEYNLTTLPTNCILFDI